MGARNRPVIFALCAGAVGALLLGAAQHAAAADAPAITVSYRDLDLSRAADARVLYQRLQRAAESVCMAPPHYELARHAAYERCVQVTLKDTVARINSVELVRVATETGVPGTDRAGLMQPGR